MSGLYRLYIDESGDHTYGKKEIRKLKFGSKTIPDNYYPELELPQKRYLGLTGIIVEAESYRTNFHPSVEQLKKEHFICDPDEPVIFERNEIINRKGSFWRLRDPAKEQSFNEALLSFLQNQEYTIITVVIDKKAHMDTYCKPFDPYHYCLRAMLERYRGFLYYHHPGAKSDVLAESRGGTEDQLLKKAYREIYNEGTKYLQALDFQSVFTSKEIKIKPKAANISGTQIADLLAHPLKQGILLNYKRINNLGEFASKICAITQQKYCCHKHSRIIDGYGKVFLK